MSHTDYLDPTSDALNRLNTAPAPLTPITRTVVANASAVIPSPATTDTSTTSLKAIPTRGSKMCENRRPSATKNCTLSPDVDTAARRNTNLRPPAKTAHPRSPGGASPQTISPLAAIKARERPIPRNTRNASSAANPFPIAPKSTRIPARPNQTRPPSKCSSRQFTNPRASAVNGNLCRHKRVNGPTVTSNAPPDASLNPRANPKTRYNSALTRRGVTPNKLTSLSAK